MSQLSRRSFLQYVGAGAAASAAGTFLGPMAQNLSAAPLIAFVGAEGAISWNPVPYPIPLPNDPDPAGDAKRFAAYTVKDDLLLPEGFRYDVVAQWGERFGPPEHQITFGFAADYTGLVPVDGAPDEFYLLVNHEYISARPWLTGYPAVMGRTLIPYSKDPTDPTRGKFAGVQLEGTFNLLDSDYVKLMNPPVVEGIRAICKAGLEDLGFSILRVRRTPAGGIEVIRDAADHRRVTAISRQNVTVPEPIRATGPAAHIVRHAPGTFSNCSGETTPWRTFLSCEENFQDQVMEWITPEGQPLPNTYKPFAGMLFDSKSGLPFEFEGLGQGVEPPLDGRHFGWVIHVDPKTGVLIKLTSLGRFRHENVALRCEVGLPLVAYMGDDRRGGHVWKFVSSKPVRDRLASKNIDLLSDGMLYVARFEKDFTGRWIPLTPATPLHRPEPDQCALGHVWLPARPAGGHVAVGKNATLKGVISTEEWMVQVEQFTEKKFGDITLGDLVRGDNLPAVILMDAYAMANAAGGTPCSRPEDIEVHPKDRSVYVAFTDSTGSGDGSPDVRIFPDSKGENSRQYGAIYRLVEDANDPAATTFKWGKFVSSGEAADQGGGFACADNLLFDQQANLWMVCDITTAMHNMPVSREGASTPGGKEFVGVFGNNSMFVFPTSGPRAGQPLCFAIGPMECELTGPTFTPDGKALLLSVQHPGELYGIRGHGTFPSEEVRAMKVAARDGSTFTQQRAVPMGSNFPSGKSGEAPRPCVVCIRRA